MTVRFCLSALNIMESRRLSVDNKRKTRQGLMLFLLSGGLLFFLLYMGINGAATLTLLADRFRKEEVVSTEDKTPPTRPSLVDFPKVTREPEITIKGYSEAGTSVGIYRNDKLITEVQVGEDSKFSAKITLEKGENIIAFIARDKAGNDSEKYDGNVVIFDNEPPFIEVTSPVDGQEVAEKVLVIEGKTEGGSKITANERIGTVDADGNFTIKYTLAEGENSILLVAIDRGENKTEKTLTVKYSP